MVINERKIKAIYLMEDDLFTISKEFQNVINRLELLIVQATNKNKTTNAAHILFPAATYAEKHGTFVNFQGRIQRIRPAVATVELDRALDGMSMSRLDKFGTPFDRWMQGKKYDAKPSWKILTLLLSKLNSRIKFEMAEDVFEALSKAVEAFKDLNYDIIGDLGIQVKNKVFELQK